ncbi:MAG TPA: phosphoribosylamine--glycine ligase [Candidatus Binataceae bacterium]|nr:phosphoribosylamine--glycine ligase [Candidatus Binataceae bacterium]
MKVLVIGKGGREHALCWRLHQSPSVWGLYCTGDNPGIAKIAEPCRVSSSDFDGLAAFAAREKIDLTVVGPEDPLAAGVVDHFKARGLTILGPSKAAAQLEASKSFAKSVMRAAGVPTAAAESFTDITEALDYVRSRPYRVVVKADGLALGKGVTVCQDLGQAEAAIVEALERKRFGAAGARILIEERLEGEELSFFALCNGVEAVPLGFVQDHKAVFDGDQGPNTGGMGAYSPLPHYDDAFAERVMTEVIRPTLHEMARRDIPFSGILFAGLMVTGTRLNVLEYNVRFGDPECESLMMRFDGDLGATLGAVAEGRVRDAAVRLSPQSAVAVVLASGGYPGEYRTGLPIGGLEQIDGDEPSALKTRWAIKRTRVKVFHAGTTLADGALVTNGGRVLVVTARAESVQQAVAAAYEAADLIRFDGLHLRRDIAYRVLGTPTNPINPG